MILREQCLLMNVYLLASSSTFGACVYGLCKQVLGGGLDGQSDSPWGSPPSQSQYQGGYGHGKTSTDTSEGVGILQMPRELQADGNAADI